nr:peptidylprolyl isomerase [Bacteroidota bacterium]
EEVDYQTFKTRYENYLASRRSQGQEVTPAMEGYMSDEMWNQVISETVLEDELNDLGITVTGEEIKTLIVGDKPHPVAMQMLGNQIDKAGIQQFWNTYETQKPEIQAQWLEFEKQLTDIRMREKYFALVKKSIFVTDLEAREDFVARNKSVSFQYVPIFLSTISDSTVEVTDADIRRYFEKHKHKEEYKREPLRALKYVAFDVNATQEDTLITEKRVKEYLESFKKTKNDSAFVVGKGGTYSSQYQARGSFAAELEDAIFIADSGTVIGPIRDGATYKLVKVLGSRPDSVYYYRTSHILITPNGATEGDSAAADRTARDLAAKARSGADFATLVRENSKDPGSAAKGGDIGWQPGNTQSLVKPYRDAMVKGSKGDIHVVRSQFGTHVIKITENRSNKLVKAVVVERAVSPSDQTEQLAYSKASEFRNAVSDDKSFVLHAQKQGMVPLAAEELRPNDRTMPGLENPRELIRWAFNEEVVVGHISDPMTIGNRYVVAIVTKAQEEGFADYNDPVVKEQLTAAIRIEKKKEMLAEKLEDALEKSKDLAAIAKEVQSSVNTAEGVNFQNAFVPNLSTEPSLVGFVMGLKKDQVAGPVKGNNGVFIVKVTTINEAPVPEKFDAERKMMMMQKSANAQDQALQAIIKEADVKDYRYRYY